MSVEFAYQGSYTAKPAAPVTARYVRVAKTVAEYFFLGQVQVYGLSPSSGSPPSEESIYGIARVQCLVSISIDSYPRNFLIG